MKDHELDELIGEKRGLIRAYKLACRQVIHYGSGPTRDALSALADRLNAQVDVVGLAIDVELHRRAEGRAGTAAAGVGYGSSPTREALSCATPTATPN